MSHVIPHFLSEDNRVMLARASVTFPGEKLNEVITRALADMPKDRPLVDFYEIRRTNVPRAFDALLKLQNTGSASRYIETDEDEFREVLRVEVTLLDAILLVLALLLDVIHGMLAPSAGGGGEPPIAVIPAPPATPEIKPYVPKWKHQAQRIGYDEPCL
ncbi:hypothetical protein [Pseudomonas fluorescens]|uniref:hypothetical protein n=1 Tax=Pseudomonas fluorescens TaxID=294 RepID=UPI00123FED2C|nr:hypothetical protein [Pseudomonas fluorescens]VVO70089.1 hypothetical protein PS898_01247 [Pseudomonas fluorescens]